MRCVTRKFLFMLLMVSSVFIVAGCEGQRPFTRDTNEGSTQEMLMESRDAIRASNVGLRVDLYEETFGGIFERAAGTSQGSGVVFDVRDGYYYALTNHHVIDSKDYPRSEYHIVPSFEDEEYEASVVDYDSSKDLALIKFSSTDLDIPLMDIYAYEGDVTELTGEMVLAVGNPSAINSMVTYGEFNGMHAIDDVDFNVIGHSALIYPGNSGGALTTKAGEFIGINTWGSEDDTRNFSVPHNEVHNFLDSVDFE